MVPPPWVVRRYKIGRRVFTHAQLLAELPRLRWERARKLFKPVGHTVAYGCDYNVDSTIGQRGKAYLYTAPHGVEFDALVACFGPKTCKMDRFLADAAAAAKSVHGSEKPTSGGKHQP